MKQKKKIWITGILALATVIVSCEKELVEQTGLDTADNIELKTAEAEMEHGPAGRAKMFMPHFDECGFPPHVQDRAVITTSGDTYPKTIEVSHASDEDHPGEMLVTLTLSDHMKTPGAVQTMQMSGSGDRGERSGTVTITNLGASEANPDQLTFSIVSEGTATGKKGTMMRSFTGEMTMKEGASTATCDDDVFEVSGTMISKRDDESHERTMESVTIARGCKHPIAGMVSGEGHLGEFSMDFGAGDCDSKATVTRLGVSKTIDLENCKRPGRGKRK